MSQITSSTSRFGDLILSELRSIHRESESISKSKVESQNSDKPSFMDHLERGIDEVNQVQKSSDSKATDLATGKETNIHETMLAASQAELTFNLMVQIRNKALEAYQEIMRMPV